MWVRARVHVGTATRLSSTLRQNILSDDVLRSIGEYLRKEEPGKGRSGQPEHDSRRVRKMGHHA